MSDARTVRSVGLGDVAPARSRHAGRRSAVALTDSLVVVGTADGTVRALDRETLAERWRAGAEGGSASVVAVTPFDDSVAVGERGPDGGIRVYDREGGDPLWRYETARDVGPPAKETRFFLPYVAATAADGDRLYVAARRYDRDGGGRSFEGVVYAFGRDGDVVWRYGTDASPIALDADGDRVAVAYNRCPGTHGRGLVVLDAAGGSVEWDWDPGTAGDRRVGDVSLCGEGVVLASHGDYCGYRLDAGGVERWRVELATPTGVGGETLYAYPNHVETVDGTAVFLTGNTYAREGRETDSLHPDEHTAFGYSLDGERSWSAPVDGFAGEVTADGDRVAIPVAQHFRARDPTVHGVRVLDPADGTADAPVTDADGVVTAVAADGGAVAAVEEPVVYHDDGTERGRYRLLVRS